MLDIKLFAGNATPELAKRISERLYISLGDATVGRFSDGEVQVQINENVRGCDVFIIQSTCAPTNDNLMELIVMVDALRRASAGRITAVIPYFGYARQDRRLRSARGVAGCLGTGLRDGPAVVARPAAHRPAGNLDGGRAPGRSGLGRGGPP